MTVIDRRKNGSGKSAPNRQKFIERHKKQIKESIKNIADKRSIKDMEKKVDIEIDGNTTHEPNYHYDPKTGKKTIVNSGNDRFSKGSKHRKPPQGGGSGRGASDSGEGEDGFTFTLTKDEFIDLYFDGMELPDFIKESMQGEDKYKFKRAGYTIDGIPMRMNSKKTMEIAIARRIAAKAQGKKKPLYLDDSDVRYDNIVKKPYPINKAVMFMVMDVSGSMWEKDKRLAKQFFTLLYLFLTRCYDEVEIRFIRHTTEASEVDEETFFYERNNGGTLVSCAFQLVNQIIEEQIDLSTTNIYVAQASDGDNWPEDNDTLLKVLEEQILPKVQYMAYIQTRKPIDASSGWSMGPSLYDVYRGLSSPEGKFNSKLVLEERHVYPVLRELFERKV